MDFSIYYEKYRAKLDELAGDENVERTEVAYNCAVDFIECTGQVSISNVQRALRIGYKHASRIVERMEVAKIVSKADNMGHRKVLTTCFANKGDSETNMEADFIVDHAMEKIDAEDEDHASVRSVVERMLAAGYTLTATCDPVGYND